MTDAHERCSRVLRNLRFDWIQDPERVLDEKLNIVGLEYEHLETDLELFEVYRKKLYHGFERRYHQLLDQCFLKWAESPSWGRF